MAPGHRRQSRAGVLPGAAHRTTRTGAHRAIVRHPLGAGRHRPHRTSREQLPLGLGVFNDERPRVPTGETQRVVLLAVGKLIVEA